MDTLSTPIRSADRTLHLLQQRIRERGHLPGFRNVVSTIVGAMHSDDDRELSMTRTVLSDPALTQRVLRLANSAMYSVFGGINTVSKAIIVLGTESIGHLALGLKLIEGLSAASHDSASMRTEMEKAVMAGHIARQVTSFASTRDSEEAVVCSMLHSLGQMMVMYYLPEQWAAIQQRCAQDGVEQGNEPTTEQRDAAHDVLGLGFDEIGRAIARNWGLPPGIVNSLQDVPPQGADEPLDHTLWLATVATMSSSCAKAVCSSDTPTAELAGIVGGYADMLGIDIDDVLAAVDHARRPGGDDAAAEEAPDGSAPEAEPMPAPNAIGRRPDTAAHLARGVVEAGGIADKTDLSQLMTMALETVFQSMGMHKAVVFLRDRKEGRYKARICLGADAQALMPRLTFGDAYEPDVFHAALANHKLIYIANAQTADFRSRLPRWWRSNLADVRSFLVMPFTVHGHPAGFLYGDWGTHFAGERLEQAETDALNDLRTLLVAAIEQRQR